jgi:hypothetical protein
MSKSCSGWVSTGSIEKRRAEFFPEVEVEVEAMKHPLFIEY